MRRFFLALTATAALALSAAAPGATYDLPTDGSTVVGKIQIVLPSPDNTLLDIARHFDVGYQEIALANPGVSVWVPGASAKIVVPLQLILPPGSWHGIVVNIAAHRLYYFPPARKGEPRQVHTYPVGIAREGWSTPRGDTEVIAKYRDPAWLVPLRTRHERALNGESGLPEYFAPGPDNPMGMLAIALGFRGIYIHGTNRPWGVGMRSSHGCLHLYPEDALQLFSLVQSGTPVRIIDEPFLVGNDRGRWVMASYPLVAEYPNARSPFTRAFETVGATISAQTAPPPGEIAWERVQRAVDDPQVVPLAIYADQPDLAQWLALQAVARYDFQPYGLDANDAGLPSPLVLNALR